LIIKITPTVGYEAGRAKYMTPGEGTSYLLRRGVNFTALQRAVEDLVAKRVPFRSLSTEWGGNLRIELLERMPDGMQTQDRRC
jgi:hypothetical protein